MLQVAVYENLSELDVFRLTWRDLLNKTRRPSFFQSPEWLENYWEYFGSGQKLKVFVVSLRGRPIGILPLVVQTAYTRLGKSRVLTYPLDGWGTVYGPIGPNPAATLAAVMRSVARSRRDWELIDLRYVDNEGTDRRRTEAALANAGFQAYRRDWQRAPAINLPETWWDFWLGCSETHRKEITSAEGLLGPDCSLVRYRPEGHALGDDDPRFDVLNQVTSVWPGGTESLAEIAGFFLDTHRTAVRRGNLDMAVLLQNGRPVASAYGYVSGGHVDGIRLAVDPQAHSLTGSLFLARLVRDGLSRGDKQVILGAGADSLASRWRTTQLVTSRYTHFSAVVPRAQAMRVGYCLRSWLGFDQTLPTPSTPAAVHTAVNRPAPRLAVVG